VIRETVSDTGIITYNVPPLGVPQKISDVAVARTPSIVLQDPICAFYDNQTLQSNVNSGIRNLIN